MTNRKTTEGVVWLYAGWIFALIALLAPTTAGFSKKPESLVPVSVDLFRVGGWIVCIVALLGILAVIGKLSTGRILGACMDSRNRYSLSRFQMGLWGVLVLGTLYAVLVSNVLRASSKYAMALDVKVDWALISLMGLSVVSFLGSTMALSVKSNREPSEGDAHNTSDRLTSTENLQGGPAGTKGLLMTKARPADARLADFIKGEEVGNAATFDLTRFQMLVITIIVLVTYAGILFQLMGDGSSAKWMIDSIPSVSETLLALIFVSHSGYITGKLVPNTQGARTDTSRSLARAMQLNQNIGDVSRSIQSSIKSTSLAPGALHNFQNLDRIVKGLEAKIATLPETIGAGATKDEELSRLEGQVDTLISSYRSFVADAPSRATADAPSPEIISRIQNNLRNKHYTVSASGVLDKQTDEAIIEFLKTKGVSRRDLHKDPYRFYEEVSDFLEDIH